ncbi:MAG: TolC family outer membrane protein [Methylococcales bacterium]|nr:TolC family outer membrane protein [Methylococcales bacterium]
MKKFNVKYLVACIILAQAPNVFAEDLMTIYHQALEADPESKAAALSMKITEEQTGAALGQMLPQISGSANWSQNASNNPGQTQPIYDSKGRVTAYVPNPNTSYPGTRYYASLNQSLFDFAKFWNWRRANTVEEQYSAENIEAQHALIYKVVEKYFGVLEAEDQLYFYQTEKNAMAKRLEQTQKQFAKQLVKVTDVYEVEARLDQLKASEIEAETIVVTAKETLKELTNTPFSDLYKLKDNVDYKPLDGQLEQWIEVAKSENPSLAAQLKAIEAARTSVMVQKSRFMPVVDLQLAYYDTNTGYQSAKATSSGNSIGTAVGAINVLVPIFDGGVSIHQLFESEHRLELAKNENEAKVRALIKETSDSFLSSNSSVRRIEASRKAVASAAKSREANESGFKFGVKTVTDILNAQQEEFRAKRELSQSKYAYIKHRARFMRSVGMITEHNIEEVNNWLQPKSLLPPVTPIENKEDKTEIKPTV